MALHAKDYELDPEQLALGKQPAALANQLGDSLLQDSLGYSNEMMLALYEIAVSLSQEKRHDDAVAAFTFITTLNPLVGPFWMALGVAQREQQDFEGATKSFDKAIEVEPENLDGYIYAIKFHLDHKDQDRAQAILDAGRERAEHADDPDAWQELLRLAPAIDSIIKQGGHS